MVPVELPDVGGSAVFTVWYARPGERVYDGDRLAEVLLPGITVDVPAPATGTLADVCVHPGDRLTAGTVLGHVRPDAG